MNQIMKNKKKGLILFWIGVVFTFLMAGLGGWGSPALISRWSQTLHMGMIPFFLWAFSVPIGALLVGIGMLIYSNAKSSRIRCFGISIFLTVVSIDFILRGYLLKTNAHFSWFYGLFGVLILSTFLFLIWYWAKTRIKFSDEKKLVADLQLVGYTFFIIATWFICGAFGAQFSESLSKFIPRSPMNIMLNLFLGWLFLLLSQKKLSELEDE
jgi:hypothetical protein